VKTKYKELNIELQGGLGNQLFIWVAGQYLSQIKKQKVRYRYEKLSSANVFELLNIEPESIKSRDIPKYLRRLRSIATRFAILRLLTFYAFGIFVSRNVGFEERITSSKSTKWAFGYFQTYRFASEDILSNMKLAINSRSTEEAEIQIINILSKNDVIVLHIRVGDYLKAENGYFGVLSEKYYLEAIESFQPARNQKILIVTDSPEYVRDNYHELLDTYMDISFVDDYGLSTLSEFRVLTRANKIVIGNSTFSWWGAFLGPEGNKVVAPLKWFKLEKTPNCLFPRSWNLIESHWN
jgi:hypothetical protein